MIEALINGVDLSAAQAEESLDFLLDGADEALISAFLVLLRAKGETYEEVSVTMSLYQDICLPDRFPQALIGRD